MTRLINSDGRDVTTDTMDAFKKAMGNGEGIEKAATIQTDQNLVAYNLEAPAKNLYPVMTPLRNRVPRKGGGKGKATNWKVVTGMKAGGVSSIPFVPEGQRAARMSVSTEDKSANFVSMGLESDVTFEAQSAGQGFEDVMSTSGMRLLQQTMILEEYAILGANRSVALGTPAAPALSAGGAGGTLPAATYSVIAVALTLEGYLAASLTTGVVQQLTVTGMDNKTYQVNGGSSQKSAAATQAIALGQNLSCSVAPVLGALAYAWFVGTAGNEKLEAITTLNSVVFSAPLVGGARQAATAITVDASRNASLAFDGLLYANFASQSTAAPGYYKALATGTPGTGTKLTATTRGSIQEIDDMLRWYWDQYRISPDEIHVHAQQLQDISAKVLSSGASNIVRFTIDVNAQNPSLVAGQVVGYYLNPFSLNGGQLIPIRLHPNMPAGTLMAWCQDLPAQYQSANVPNVAEVETRRDYYQIPWPIITRANETGVYAEEVLKVYAPFAIGIITNIAAG